MPSVRSSGLASALVTLLSAGCATSPFDRNQLSDELTRRTGHALPPADRPPPAPAAPETWSLLPPGVRVDDGLTEDEAVAIALWNNAAFLADLSTLELSRADLIKAGMIRNPVFTMMLPLGPKQLEFTALLPIEEIWQRPARVAAAKVEVERVAHSLVQTGLDLVRDARTAHAELILAQRREAIALRLLTVRQEITRIAAARLKSGDISLMEADAANLDAVNAHAEQVQLARSAAAAREALWLRLGFGQQQLELVVVDEPASNLPPLPLATALQHAIALRPDLRGAELAIEVAGARLGWERTRILSTLSLIADANGSGSQGFEIGPGFSLEVPILNQNQGALARGHVELEQAAWRYIALRQQVQAEVRAALLDHEAAAKALLVVRATGVETAERNLERAHRAFAAGDVSYLLVLDSSRQLLDVLQREASLHAALKRSAAQLDRSIGSKYANR